MAKLTRKKPKKSIEVEDGKPLRRPAEEIGVIFGCNNGVCGACKIDVLKGEENLSELTQPEKNAGLNRKERFACQCNIKSGEVLFDY